MKLGIISDTHDQVERISGAVALFQQEKVERVYHLGDWCSPFVLPLFSPLSCPVKGIFGNNDADVFKYFKVKPGNVELCDRFFTEEVDSLRVCLVHGDPEELVEAVVESGRYDVVFRGHNHVAGTSERGETLVVNPGSLVGAYGGNPQWTAPSVAIFDTRDRSARIVAVGAGTFLSPSSGDR